MMAAGSEVPWWALIIAPIIGAGITLVVFSFKSAWWGGRFAERLKSIEESVKRVDRSVEQLAKEVRKDIKQLFALFPTPPPATGPGSPVRLTDFGKEISATVNADDWAREHAPSLVEDATGREEFEIFELCVERVSNAFQEDAEFEKTVKSGAYQIGTKSESVLDVYNVVLRDAVMALLEENEG